MLKSVGGGGRGVYKLQIDIAVTASIQVQSWVSYDLISQVDIAVTLVALIPCNRSDRHGVVNVIAYTRWNVPLKRLSRSTDIKSKVRGNARNY